MMVLSFSDFGLSSDRQQGDQELHDVLDLSGDLGPKRRERGFVHRTLPSVCIMKCRTCKDWKYFFQRSFLSTVWNLEGVCEEGRTFLSKMIFFEKKIKTGMKRILVAEGHLSSKKSILKVFQDASKNFMKESELTGAWRCLQVLNPCS